jgi:hypothetical protein
MASGRSNIAHLWIWFFSSSSSFVPERDDREGEMMAADRKAMRVQGM